MTFNDLWGHTLFYEKLRLLNVSIHSNPFINECTRKKKGKIPESCSHRVSEVFLWDVEELTFFLYLSSHPSSYLSIYHLHNYVSRSNAELVTENLYLVFDPHDTGIVGFNELLMAFSMSMNGKGNLSFYLPTNISVNNILINIYISIYLNILNELLTAFSMSMNGKGNLSVYLFIFQFIFLL